MAEQPVGLYTSIFEPQNASYLQTPGHRMASACCDWNGYSARGAMPRVRCPRPSKAAPAEVGEAVVKAGGWAGLAGACLAAVRHRGRVPVADTVCASVFRDICIRHFS